MSLLHKRLFESVVSINKFNPFKNQLFTIGTGFIIKHKKNNIVKYFLASNMHVFKNIKNCFVNLFDSSIENKRYFRLKDIHLMKANDDIDVILIDVTKEILKLNLRGFGIPSKMMLPTTKMSKMGIREGNEIYSLGHPINLTVSNRFFPICRTGSIARISNIYKRNIKITKQYLVDCFSFPGNSGGPIFLKPSYTTYKDEKPIKDTYLIGILNATVNLLKQNDSSTQEINIGLSNIIACDYIIDILERDEKNYD